MENSITVGEELRKYFYESGLNFLSSVPQRRIQKMILAMAQKGHSGKMVDCGELGAGHRITYGHFLSNCATVCAVAAQNTERKWI